MTSLRLCQVIFGLVLKCRNDILNLQQKNSPRPFWQRAKPLSELRSFLYFFFVHPKDKGFTHLILHFFVIKRSLWQVFDFVRWVSFGLVKNQAICSIYKSRQLNISLTLIDSSFFVEFYLGILSLDDLDRLINNNQYSTTDILLFTKPKTQVHYPCLKLKPQS